MLEILIKGGKTGFIQNVRSCQAAGYQVKLSVGILSFSGFKTFVGVVSVTSAHYVVVFFVPN